MDSIFIFIKLESFLNTPAVQDEEVDLTKYADLSKANEEEIKELDLDEIKSDSITVTYEGGGDSGYIENQYESSNGGGDVPAGIEDICYQLLEDFGGWEINEGSQGSIILSRDEIEVEHEWNVQEEHWEEANIVITPETFNE